MHRHCVVVRKMELGGVLPACVGLRVDAVEWELTVSQSANQPIVTCSGRDAFVARLTPFCVAGDEERTRRSVARSPPLGCGSGFRLMYKWLPRRNTRCERIRVDDSLYERAAIEHLLFDLARSRIFEDVSRDKPWNVDLRTSLLDIGGQQYETRADKAACVARFFERLEYAVEASPTRVVATRDATRVEVAIDPNGRIANVDVVAGGRS